MMYLRQLYSYTAVMLAKLQQNSVGYILFETAFRNTFYM